MPPISRSASFAEAESANVLTVYPHNNVNRDPRGESRTTYSSSRNCTGEVFLLYEELDDLSVDPELARCRELFRQPEGTTAMNRRPSTHPRRVIRSRGSLHIERNRYAGGHGYPQGKQQAPLQSRKGSRRGGCGFATIEVSRPPLYSSTKNEVTV